MLRLICTTITTLLIIISLFHQADASDIRVLGHTVPPFSMHSSKGKVTGFSADLFKLAFQDMPEFNHDNSDHHHMIPVTFKRLYTELQRAKKRIGLTVGRNSTRENLFKWVGPYMQLNLGVVAKKERYFEINSIEDFAGYKIGTIENTAPEQALLKMGLKQSSLKRDIYPQRNIIKLLNNKIEFIAYPLQATSYLMKINSIDANDYEEVFPLRKIKLYFAFSKDFSDDDIQRYQTRLDKILGSEQFEELKRKYALEGISKYAAQLKQ